MTYPLKEIIRYFTASHLELKGVYRLSISPNSRGIQQSAPFPGFLFPLGGQGRFEFDGTAYTTDSGKVLHGSADATLGKAVLSDVPLQYISVLYESNRSKAGGLYVPHTHFEIEFGHSPRLNGLLNRLWKSVNDPGYLAHFRVQTLFYCILEEVFTCADHFDHRSDKARFDSIAAYVRENYADDLNVSDLQELYDVTSNQLYYLFTKYTGMGPEAYLMTYRLNRAKELILTTDFPIKYISMAVGYEDPLYFSRLFKRKQGMSPTAFRNTFRNNPYPNP